MVGRHNHPPIYSGEAQLRNLLRVIDTIQGDGNDPYDLLAYLIRVVNVSPTVGQREGIGSN